PDYWEEIVNSAIENNVEVLPILDYWNPFHDDGLTPHTDEGIAAYARFCGAVAAHFKGRLKYYEIWNEYNINFANNGFEPPETYAKMLMAAHAAIKAADPDAFIVGCCTCGLHMEWIRRVLVASGPQYMDAMSIHAYCMPAMPDDDLGHVNKNMNKARELTKQFGDEKPIWMTEIGWATNRADGGVTREMQAAAFARMFALKLKENNADKILWYDLLNDSHDIYEREHEFGVLESLYCNTVFGAKEAYLAISAVNSLLNGAEFISEKRTGAYTRILELNNNGNLIKMFWSLDRSEPLTFAAEGTVTLIDMYGNEQNLQAVNGRVTVASSVCPQYIIGVGDAVEDAALLTMKSYDVDCVAGESVCLRVCRNAAIEKCNVSYRYSLPAGFKAEEKDGDIWLTVPLGANEREYAAEITCETDGAAGAVLPLTIKVQPPFRLVTKPALVDGVWKLAAEVTNYSNRRRLSGRLCLNEPEQWRVQSKMPDYNEKIIVIRLSEDALFDVAPLETQTMLFRTPDGVDNTVQTVGMVMYVDNGPAIYSYHRVSFFGIHKTDRPIVIDGNLTEEKWGAPQITLDEKDFLAIRGHSMQEGFSAKVFLRWDDDNFYIAARVFDKCHHQDCTCGDLYQDLWDGDGLQFVFDPTRETRTHRLGYNEFCMALTHNTHQTFVWRYRSIVNRTMQLLKTVQCKIVRDGDFTIYEAAFPWKELLPYGVKASEGADFGFALGINDNNGEGVQGRLDFNKGLGFWFDQEAYNPSLCGDLVLLP
ncbi:MAG: sugar-binding protein, partial [Acutalibacteraceae bacterium]